MFFTKKAVNDIAMIYNQFSFQFSVYSVKLIHSRLKQLPENEYLQTSVKQINRMISHGKDVPHTIHILDGLDKK